MYTLYIIKFGYVNQLKRNLYKIRSKNKQKKCVK